jgi:hypothetical protein
LGFINSSHEAVLKRILASDSVDAEASALNILQHMLIISENKAFGTSQWKLMESVANVALTMKPTDDYANGLLLTPPLRITSLLPV